MEFLCTLKNALLIIRNHFGLVLASKGLGYLAAVFLLLSLLARYKLPFYQTTLLLVISALVDITLLKTTCHFLLLLIGFDTLTYQKELQLIPYTCGSSILLRFLVGPSVLSFLSKAIPSFLGFLLRICFLSTSQRA